MDGVKASIPMIGIGLFLLSPQTAPLLAEDAHKAESRKVLSEFVNSIDIMQLRGAYIQPKAFGDWDAADPFSSEEPRVSYKDGGMTLLRGASLKKFVTWIATPDEAKDYDLSLDHVLLVDRANGPALHAEVRISEREFFLRIRNAAGIPFDYQYKGDFPKWLLRRLVKVTFPKPDTE